MKRRVLAILTTMLMLMAMVPAMAFAEDAQPAAEPQMVGITIGVGNGGELANCEVTFEDGEVTLLDFETVIDVSGEVGKKICEALKIAAVADPVLDGNPNPFLGWNVYEPGAGTNGEPKELDTQITTEELMNYVIPNHNLMIEAQFDEEMMNGDDGEGDGDGDWNGIPTFAVSGNGGSLVIKDSAENFNGSTDSYYGEFRSSENVAKAVSFKIVSVEKAGAVLSGWTVYEADRVEIDSIPASVAKENGGLPPWGDPDLKHFLFDEYVEDGVEMNTFIGLWNHKIIDASMSTEELYNLGGNDKSYYAVANWTTGTVKEMTVNGQPARLEIAGDIVAVDSNLKAKFETVEKIKEALVQEAYRANENFLEESMKIEYMDIVLKIKNKDGVWEVATPENFPEEGIEVVIPYPAETNKDAFQFSVLHMFTHGSKAGSIETLKPEIKNDGLHVVVHSLSPFAVAYQEMDKSPAMGDTANMLPWIIMAVMAAAAGALVFRRRTN